MKKTILLVLADDRISTEALHWSLHRSKESGLVLKVVYVENGFPSYSKITLDEIEKQGRSFLLPIQTDFESGNYFDICIQRARDVDVEQIVVVEKQSFLKRIFKGSESEILRGKMTCSLKVYPSDPISRG